MFVLNPKAKHTQTVIFLAKNFRPWLSQFVHMFLDKVISDLPEGRRVVLPLQPEQKIAAFGITANSWFDLREFKEVPEDAELQTLPPQKDINDQVYGGQENVPNKERKQICYHLIGERTRTSEEDIKRIRGETWLRFDQNHIDKSVKMIDELIE